MPSRTLIPLVVLALCACARHAIPPVVLTAQTRIGPAADYGPGIRDVTPSDVDVVLDAPAYIIALRVTRELGIQVIAPLSGSPKSKPGTHYFRGGAVPAVDTSMRTVSSKSCTVGADSRESCTAVSTPYRVTQLKLGGTASEAPGYWVLIVSDTPTPGREVMRRLGLMNLADASLESLVQRLPPQLIDSRTTHWAAYYAAFGGASNP